MINVGLFYKFRMLFCCPIAGHPQKTGAAAVATSSNNTQIPKTYGDFWKKPFSKKRSKKCRTVHRFSMALHHNARMLFLKNAKTVFRKFAPRSACSAMAPSLWHGAIASRLRSRFLRRPLRGASLRGPLCTIWAVRCGEYFCFVFFSFINVPPLSPILFLSPFPLPLFFFFPLSPFPSSFCVHLSLSPLPSNTKPQTLRRKRDTKP